MNYADKWTDEKLKILEKKIFKLFFEAQKDFESLSKEYFENFAERDKEYSKLVESGEITQEEYKQWRLNQMGRGERLDEMAAKMAERATAANEVAVAYINDLTPSVYSLNRNYEAYVIESLGHEMVGTDFTLYNEAAVRRMVVENPTVMPFYPKEKAVARNIDLAYGQKVIKNKVTSGILQGKSVYDISDDLQKDLATMSRTSAVRAARTAVTSAQNGGKMASMTAAKNMGIKLRKRWVATKDARTRDVHAEADGQTVEIDKPFEVGGEKLMFPGDGSASGWNLYNCRCTMRTVEKDGIEAEPRQMRVRNPETGEWELVSDMTYQEWVKTQLTSTDKNDKIIYGAISGALDPDSERANAHAAKYYESVRKMTTDVEKISAATGFTKEEISKVKNYVFYEEHNLGDESPSRFFPNYMMGQSWQRLIDGKPEPHDITLIQHELMERELVLQGYSQAEAHIEATRYYNYSREAEDYYSNIKEHSAK